MTALPPEELRAGGQIDIYWEQVQGRVYKAFDELRTAARTDPSLAATFNPAMAEFDRARRRTALDLFAQDMIDKPYFDQGAMSPAI